MELFTLSEKILQMIGDLNSIQSQSSPFCMYKRYRLVSVEATAAHSAQPSSNEVYRLPSFDNDYPLPFPPNMIIIPLPAPFRLTKL